MEEKNEEIKEAELEVEAPIETEVERAQKKRREAIFELGLFFVLGVLIGITLKTEAVKKVTMGFNDYQIKKPAQSYDINAIRKKLESQYSDQQAQQQIQSQGEQQDQTVESGK